MTYAPAITVLGSINVDLFLTLPHLPAAGETVLTPSFVEAVGGKGANQAVAAARDGAVTKFIGATGRDGFGATARAAMTAAGVDIAGLVAVDGPTGLATIWVDRAGRNAIAVASGANGTVDAGAVARMHLAPGALLVLQMEIPPAVVAGAIAAARAAGAHIILNLAPALALPLAAMQKVDILVVNEHEAATLCHALGEPAAADASRPADAMRAIARHIPGTVVVTCGAKGAIARHGGRELAVPALPVDVVDTTGAGDCFVGVLAAAIVHGTPIPAALARAAVAASLACRRIGAMPSYPSRAEIDTALAAR